MLSLRRIAHWTEGGRYSRLDQLQTDLLAVFAKARKRGGEEAEDEGARIRQRSRVLERQFLLVRDELCKKGEVLWSPALQQRTLK